MTEDLQDIERIDRVAIKAASGHIYALPEPCRHCDVFCEMQKRGEHHASSVQGFLTTRDRFVDRTEGYKVAKAAGQIIYRPDVTPTPGTLYSEDLW